MKSSSALTVRRWRKNFCPGARLARASYVNLRGVQDAAVAAMKVSARCARQYAAD
jgi:hypothetical protein